jgi:hypothetical protein
MANQKLRARRSLRMAAIFGALVVGPVGVFATALPITDNGILMFSNLPGLPFGITSTVPYINWGGGSTCVPGTTHPMAVSGFSNLFLAPSSGTIQDLPALPPPTLTNFLTVSGAGALIGQTIHFDLASVPVNGPSNVGNCASNAPLNSCAPAFSPFTLLEDITGTQVTILFSVLMNAYTGTSASGITPYRAVFSLNQSGS